MKVQASRRQKDPRKMAKISYRSWCGLEVRPAGIKPRGKVVKVNP